MIPKFLTIDQVIKIHDTFLSSYGGLEGIRDQELLSSAIEMPKMAMFGEELHTTIYDKAAAYLYHIVMNHPFNDGNKRTGAGSALMFLRGNNIEIDYEADTYVRLVVNVAKGEANKSEISHFFLNCSNQPLEYLLTTPPG